MDFELTDEQRLLQDTVRQFVDDRILPNAVENDINHHLDLGAIEGMAELGILGIVIMPWRLLADPSGYIFTWLLGYSGGLGSIAGVLITDYWLVRKKRLKLEDLYLTHGVYRYRGGWDLKAVAATVVVLRMRELLRGNRRNQDGKHGEAGAEAERQGQHLGPGRARRRARALW